MEIPWNSKKNTVHTKSSRINRRAILAGAAAIPVLTGEILDAAPTDPLVVLCAEHQRLRAAWIHEAEKPGAGDFNTPECLRLERDRMEFAQVICRTTATTLDGLAAQLEFVIEERWGPDENEFGSQIFATMLAGAKEMARRAV